MAATDTQIYEAARDSLLRILESDASELSEAERAKRHLEIDKLQGVIDRFESKAARSSRRIFQPVRRVNI